MRLLVGLLSLLIFLGAILAPRDLADSLQMPPALAAMLPQRAAAPTATPAPTALTGLSGEPMTAAPASEPTPRATPRPTVKPAAPVPAATPVPTPAPTAPPAPTATPTPAPTPVSYTLSGRVRSSANGDNISGVTVKVYTSANLGLVATAVTGGDGRYSLKVVSGSYKIEFSPPPAYVGEWWDNRSTSALATVVTVTSSNKTGINPTLDSK